MINRLLIITLLAFAGLLAYGQAADAFVTPSQCPCDNETSDGNGGPTGNEILDMLCPGGELAEGADFVFDQGEVLVFSEELAKSYGVFPAFSEGPFDFCLITADGSSNSLRLRPGTFELCRQSLIQRCNLTPERSIPTLSEWGMIATAGVLGLVGLYAIRRRRAEA